MDVARAARLEMLLVVAWIDAGRPDSGELVVELSRLQDEMDLPPDRRGALEVLTALGDLEDAGRATVSWEKGIAVPPTVTLSPQLLAESRRTFGA